MLSAQPNEVTSRPMANWRIETQVGELLFYDETDGLIPSVLSQSEWDAVAWETPLDAFNAYYNLRSFKDYQKISFTPKKFSQKKEDYFKAALTKKASVTVNVEFILKTKLDGSDIAFVKYKMRKPDTTPVYGCYSFRYRDGRWFYSGEKGRRYLCITLAYLKNDVLENLVSGLDNGQPLQAELNQLVRTDDGVDLKKLVEIVGQFVAKKRTDSTSFDSCCNQIK